ncbi:MAG TPA: aldehyde dehydrogenase family protein [Candidatus Handelsmanbacteria bacterium]|nr:aldehyde dehydrogenase family protein [Candidatus Handelsmanbacteria bacterium]
MRYALQAAGIKGSGEYQEVVSPYTGEVIAEVEQADDAAVEAGLVQAEETFKAGVLPPYQRADILHNLAAQMKDRHEELSLTIAQEGGKPLKDARVEVTRAVNTVRLSAEEATQIDGEQQAMGGTAGNENKITLTLREPIGVVSSISAFNHPVNLIAHQVAPPLAAGNSVVLKPSGDTPISALKLGEMLQKAGLPAGYLSILPCEPPVAQTLATDPRINYLSFIGSAKVGWHLRRVAADGTRVGLEHGGNAPAIVAADADLQKTAQVCLPGGYYHAGQVCVSVQRLYLHRSIADQFIDIYKPMVESLIVGDPTLPETGVGPLIRPREVERVKSWVDAAVAEGAEIVTGGEVLEHNCFQPTLLKNVQEGMDVVDKEVFGPVVSVIVYDDIEEAVAGANAGPNGFQAAVFTQDINTGLHAAKKLDFSAVMLNDSTAFRVDWMPFGGRHSSGLGMGGVKYSIEEMTQLKLIVLNL